MKKLSSALSVMLLTGISGFVLAPAAMADEWDLRTIVTFHQPVEIPHMVLGPGTYVIKLTEPRDGNIVQFFNENQTHLYAMVMAIPTYRLTPTDDTVITFEERAANSPRAIKKWFYPGHNFGEEFVYPKAQQLAAAPAPPTEPRLEPRAPEPKPEATPVPQATVTPVPKPQAAEVVAEATPPAAAPEPAQVPEPQKELPKTGSDLPLVALLGTSSLTAGALLRALLRRKSA